MPAALRASTTLKRLELLRQKFRQHFDYFHHLAHANIHRRHSRSSVNCLAAIGKTCLVHTSDPFVLRHVLVRGTWDWAVGRLEGEIEEKWGGGIVILDSFHSFLCVEISYPHAFPFIARVQAFMEIVSPGTMMVRQIGPLQSPSLWEVISQNQTLAHLV